MSEIDFPPGNQSPFFDPLTGDRWDFINKSWVRALNYVKDGPNNDDIEYCRKNAAWSEIVYPIPVDDPNDGGMYIRQNNAWVAAVPNLGPEFLETAAGLYGIDQATGEWKLVPESELLVNYYDKAASDARFAPVEHTHDITTLDNYGTMASQDDAPVGIPSYVRQNQAWVDIQTALPPAQIQSNSITIIDPIETDDAPLFYTPREITVTEVKAAALGDGTNTNGDVLFNVYHAATANGSDTGGVTPVFLDNQRCQSGKGDEVFTISAPTIPAGHWVWVMIINPPIDTKFFHVTIIYTEV